MILTIDPEFKTLIPPLTPEERAGLEESLLKEGCRDAIVVWNNTIIDGHNRYEICTKHGIEFQTVEKEFESRDHVVDWIYSNQLSRRNLTDQSRTYLMGKQYSARKKREPFKGNQYTSGGDQNDPQQNTAEKIGKEQGVSAATVKRAEEYSKAVDKISDACGGEELKQKILSGELKATQKDIVNLAKEPSEKQERVIETLSSGDVKGYRDAKRVISSEDTHTPQRMDGKYRVIYADPPWSYGGSMNRNTYGTADSHYPTMSQSDICALPVKDICEDNAVLFLWATSPQLPEAMEVIKSWGFVYKASFVWDKVKHVMGHYNSVRHEFLFVATRGSCTPEVMKLFDSVVSEERTEHSKKPETFRGIIETLYPSASKIELFAREPADGWDVWGNQV